MGAGGRAAPPRTAGPVGPGTVWGLSWSFQQGVPCPEAGLREVVTPPQLGSTLGEEEPSLAGLAQQANSQLPLGQGASCSLAKDNLYVSSCNVPWLTRLCLMEARELCVFSRKRKENAEREAGTERIPPPFVTVACGPRDSPGKPSMSAVSTGL